MPEPEIKTLYPTSVWSDVLYVLLKGRQPYLHLVNAQWRSYSDQAQSPDRPPLGVLVGEALEWNGDRELVMIQFVRIDQFEELLPSDTTGEKGAHRLIVLDGTEEITKH